MKTVLQVQNMEKYYGNKGNVTKAVDGISFDVEKGEYIGIMGASGSGKTTLLNCISTIDRVTSGHIFIDGMDVTKLKGKHLSKFRREQLGFIFQDFNLLDTLTAYENIVLPVRLDGKIEDKKFLEKIIDFLELDGRLSSYPNHLSGGQQQRVAIARALISKPAIILADEPTGNLDSRTSEKVIDLLKMTSEKFHQTIVMITHNPEIAEKADMRIRIEDGKITHKERLK